MHIVGQEKPALSDISHFGVKGMKWGQRRAARRERNVQIKTARKNIRNQQDEINSLVRRSNKTKNPAERAKLDKLATKKAKDLFESPDQLTASRMTTGDKWVTGLLVGGAVTIAGASRALV